MGKLDKTKIVYSWDGPPQITLKTTEVTYNGRSWLQHILENDSSSGIGVIIVATHKGKQLFNYHYRPTFENFLIEYPKGYGTASYDESEASKSLDDGKRELLEETGLTTKNSALLGYIYPDVGVMNSKVAVIAVEIDRKTKMTETDGEVDQSYWIPITQVKEMIRRSEIRDGLTLSAFTLWREFFDAYSLGKTKKESFCEYLNRTLDP